MPARSAGLLPFRRAGDMLSVLLVHPGGPLWRRKDAGAWSIPKGLVEPGEDDLAAARRETAEELGTALPGEVHPLGEARQAGGKRVVAWAIEADFDPAMLRSSTFTMEWPPRSGRTETFSEVDRAAWFELEEARARILAGQLPFLERLLALQSRR